MDVDAIIHVALCHAYGIGTRKDWDKCVHWIKKAALSGNPAGLVFWNNISSDALNESDKTQRVKALLGLGNEYAKTGKFWESVTVLESIRHTCHESYSFGHVSLPAACLCRVEWYKWVNQISLLENNGAYALGLLWEWPRQSPEATIPEYLNDLIKQWKLRTCECCTLLHLIAMCFHPRSESTQFDIVRRIGEILIQKGCPINAHSESSSTPLVPAALSRNFSVMELLIQRGAVLTEPDWEKMKRVVQAHDYEVLEKVLPIRNAQGKGKDDAHWFELSLSLVDFALAVPIAERKLRHGPRYETRGKRTLVLLLEQTFGRQKIPPEQGLNLLTTTVHAGNTVLFKEVAEHMSDFTSILNKPGREFVPLLHQSIMYQQRDIFEELLERGADLNGVSVMKNRRPIHIAAQHLMYDPFFFEELIAHGANVDVADDQGVTVLDLLIKNQCAEEHIRSIIVKAPELVNQKGYKRRSILVSAAGDGYPAIVSALLESGFDVTSTDENGFSPVYNAAIHHGPEALENLKVLLAYEVNKMPANQERRTRLGNALRGACSAGNTTAAQLLLESGADPNFVDGNPPFFLAHHRRSLYRENVDKKLRRLASHEEGKFHKMRNLLLHYKLNENHRWGGNKTSEQHCTEFFKT